MKIKSKRTLDDIEQSILEKDFERASELLSEKGYKKLSDLATTLNSIYPYMDSEKDMDIIVNLVMAYRQQKLPAKKKLNVYNTLSEAMQKYKIEAAYSAKDELIVKEKAKAKERNIINREQYLLSPQTKFNPLPINTKIGVAYSDIVIIGNSKSIIDALDEYDYVCEIFSPNQLIVRNVTLIGVREDTLYVPSQHDIKDMRKKKIKAGDWETEVKEKHKSKRFFISQVAKIVDKIKSLGHRKVVISQVRRYKNHYYLMLLPRTVVSKPYCKERMGKLIPIIREWDILVV